MGSAALVTAGVAAALLVVVLGVDVTMTTTYALDAWTGSSWRELARDPMSGGGYYAQPHGALSANASDEVRFRLRVENGSPWAVDARYSILHLGEEVVSGDISAPARGSGESEFSIPAARLLDAGPREPRPASYEAWVMLEVRVDGDFVFARAPPSFSLREVPR